MGYAAVLVAGLCAAAAPFAAAQRQAADRPPVDELVRALQARYQQVRDFSASFV